MRRTLGIVGGLALGAALSQFPEYAQQYTQRLGGAVDELRIITTEFDTAAAAAGLTREAAIARYTAAGDSFIEGRGQSVTRTFSRYDELSAMLTRIRGADAVARVTLLPQFLDSEIGARALDDFKPAIPVTPEGLAYGGTGFVLGYLATSGIVRFLMLPFRRRRPREQRA
ncbi:DUF2937 family protein [Devosia sp.]|jgi:hypothetical protein|uniref:DUF2937 family protein n=1 Tax=Devosia sp. TaxID=1871048 RepID=UPI0037BEC733